MRSMVSSEAPTDPASTAAMSDRDTPTRVASWALGPPTGQASLADRCAEARPEGTRHAGN